MLELDRHQKRSRLRRNNGQIETLPGSPLALSEGERPKAS